VPAGARPSHSFLAIDAGPVRDTLADRLAAHGVETKKYFRPLHTMPPFAGEAELPVTERLARSLLCLPLHPGLTEADVDHICGLIAG
jgi:dTDP-4-amino-4,6-dideoxygalactose transaminase